MDKEKVLVQVTKNDYGWERTSMSLCEIKPDLFKGSLIFLKGLDLFKRRDDKNRHNHGGRKSNNVSK
jgi:hypothetical protein